MSWTFWRACVGIVLNLAGTALLIFSVPAFFSVDSGIDFGSALLYSGFMALLAFGYLIKGLRARKQFNELDEYDRKGTINGIRAWRVFDEIQKT